MARKRFQLIFPDGSRKHIGTVERDKHLIALEVERIDDTSFRFVGDPKPKCIILHKLEDLGSLRRLSATNVGESLSGPKFLAGSFVIDHKGKRTCERLESVTGMVCRMQSEGMLGA
jgi:hypothetical protein